MRRLLCAALLASAGCGPGTPNAKPSGEDANGSAVVRLDYLSVWQLGAAEQEPRIERDRVERAAEPNAKATVHRRVVFMTPTPPDPKKAIQEYADRLTTEVQKIAGATVQPVEKLEGNIGPTVSIRYTAGERTGSIHAALATLEATPESANQVVEFLGYPQGKEFALGRGGLQERKGSALVVHVEEAKK